MFVGSAGLATDYGINTGSSDAQVCESKAQVLSNLKNGQLSFTLFRLHHKP